MRHSAVDPSSPENDHAGERPVDGEAGADVIVGATGATESST